MEIQEIECEFLSALKGRKTIPEPHKQIFARILPFLSGIIKTHSLSYAKIIIPNTDNYGIGYEEGCKVIFLQFYNEEISGPWMRENGLDTFALFSTFSRCIYIKGDPGKNEENLHIYNMNMKTLIDLESKKFIGDKYYLIVPSDYVEKYENEKRRLEVIRKEKESKMKTLHEILIEKRKIERENQMSDLDRIAMVKPERINF